MSEMIERAGGGSGTGDATEAKQDTIIAAIGTPAVDLAADIAAISAGDATEAKQDTAQTAIDKIPKSDGVVTFNATALASIQTEANDALVANNLDHLALTTDGAGAYPNTVVDSTILSKILSKVANGDTSSYNNTTDSLEAIADGVAAIPTTAMRGTDNAALASVLGALDSAAATGAVTDTDVAMAYIKQLVTDVIALTSAVGTNMVVTGTFTTGSATVPADTDRNEADDYWNGCILVPLTGDVAFQPRVIDDFANSTGVFTLRKAFTAATGTVTYAIIPRQDSVPTGFKDIWCTAQINDITITTAGADKDFPDVVVAAQGAARGLPLNSTCTEAYLLMMFDTLDTSAAANYIKTAADDIRVMIDGQAWTDAPIAWASVAGDWYTPASGMASQVIVGANNVVLATYGVTTTGAGTYHVGTDETAASKALESQGATLALKNVRTGLILYYKI